jgi:peptidoglycan/LPS O-acetylase OafA/YrhL
LTAQDPRFPLMDSLRAVAALSVFAYHVCFLQGWLGDGRGSAYLAELNLGVSIFFVLSGFLLYRPYVRARCAGERTPPVVPYAIRRVARIVPAYWVALTLIAIWLPLSGVFTADGIPVYYLLLQAYDTDTVTGGIGQAWTLSVEVSFYALLPLLALAVRVLPGPVVRGELVLVALMFTAGVAWKVALFPEAGSAGTALVTLPAFLDQFAAGMALALLSVVLFERERQPVLVRVVERRPWVPWLVAALAFAPLGLRDGLLAWSPVSELIEKHTLKTAIAVGLILPAVLGAAAGGWVRRVLGFRPLLWLGMVSYAFYLWHLAVLEKLEAVGPVGFVVLGLAGTAAVSAVSWYAVERPGLRAGRRLARRAGGSPAPVPAASARGA